MQTVKQEIGNLMNNLPDDCSLDDIQYHLYVMQKVRRGLVDVKEGNVFTQAEMEERMARWIRK